MDRYYDTLTALSTRQGDFRRAAEERVRSGQLDKEEAEVGRCMVHAFGHAYIPTHPPN